MAKRIFSFVFALMIFCAVSAAADGTSFSYRYDYWNTSVPVPNPYTASKSLSGDDFGSALNAPSDVVVAGDGNVYILDAGNSRVVVLDGTLKFIREIKFTRDGQPITFAEASGLFVRADGSIYIADKKAPTVYIASSDGNITGTIDAPPSDRVEADFVYAPTKIALDSAGNVYILSANTYSGALQYDPDLNFTGYYGSESVAVTASVLIDSLWKRILSKEQASGLRRHVPTSFINFDIDKDNFVYTIKGGTGLGTGQVRKLNSSGVNILLNEEGGQAAFGDIETWFDNSSNLTIATSLTDITVDDDGFITVLDTTRKRLFQYDQSSTLLYAFGGPGSQSGTFDSPVAVASLGDTLLVLDSARGTLTSMKPTDFAQNVRLAITLYTDGLYEQAREPWERILMKDAGYEPANIGMGKVYERTGEYDLAMEFYRRGNSKLGYSEAFAGSRDDGMRTFFPFVLAAVIVLLIGMVAIVSYKERHRKNDYRLKISKWKFPLRTLAHPFKGYYEMKLEKKGSLLIANFVLIAFFIVSILQRQLTGFHFNNNRIDRFNIFVVLGMTIGLFTIWVVCNWAVSTLASGEGKFRDIWISTAYAVIPWVISMIVLIVLSNTLSLNEGSFLSVFQVLAYLWAGLHLLVATREVHQFTTGGTVVISAATVLGIFLVMVFVTIGYSMFTQLLSFLGMMFNETRLRFF